MHRSSQNLDEISDVMYYFIELKKIYNYINLRKFVSSVRDKLIQFNINKFKE